jgi:hypothetical protein
MGMNEASQDVRRVAEAVRAACIQAARVAFEQASMSGLCCEGAWECAVGAMQTLDLGACTAVDPAREERTAPVRRRDEA